MDLRALQGAPGSEHPILPPGEDLVSGRARRGFPTGVAFAYYTSSIDDAVEVVRAYQSS